MDGILKGHLSLTQRISGRLSIPQGDGSRQEPVLISRTITANGTYRAADENADGYADVTSEVHPGQLFPHAYDLSTGYVMNGAWIPGGDTVNYSDVYEIRAGEVYIIIFGSTVGTRFRCMFSEADTSIAEEKVQGKSVANISNPVPYAHTIFKPPSDGFITITKDNAGTANLKTYVFGILSLIDENA